MFVEFLLADSPASEFYVPTFWNTLCSVFICGAYTIKFRSRVITQKKEYNIQNTAKV